MRGALIVLDGWGLAPEDQTGRDAVAAAETPNFDRYRETGAAGTLTTHGRAVGLPEGQMGNSEVGHLNIGAGRVVKQDSTRVSDDIADGSFFENDQLVSAFDYADRNGGRVHLMGLLSDGGVHSMQEHLHALVEMADRQGVPAVTHAFTDGRDTAPTSGAGFLREFQAVTDEYGTGDVATVTGRYYAMDRDQNWERTKRAFDAIVNREAPHEVSSAVEAVERSYERDTTDEYVEPTLVEGEAALSDGDAVVFFNFRADRARQLVRMLADIRPEWDLDTSSPDTRVVTMTEYDATFDLPVAYPPNQPADVLGEVLADAGLSQLRAAESEKYAHVTYFLNGGREVAFEGEEREIIDSPDVATYDQQPEMHAHELTDAVIGRIEREDPGALVLNYANPDMVGHTGDFDAAVAAVEAVDEQLGRLVAACHDAGAHVLVTADHGNADDMGTEADPHTAHTTNPVPFVSLPAEGGEGGVEVRDGGVLADLAPTLLDRMGLDQPEAMTGASLLE
ncbi:2,3-bisphosphoglycerate-independent phosphoglycerate mutase [Haloglomus halophilum]|uniref:2,3-bisphosphoglycerate-independent phosphoglycerate mutase n=1 Tax=Haloglomus halophilum TaxID=2962672 RepID=UPI0020CA240D|nr:2,3-bisphosphoglycerate-independent phosphoglycerate mutase [Haloglomus halophilum]